MELDSAQLASLSGDYRMPDGSLLSLRLEGDQITTNGVPFLTVSENRLEAPTFGAVIEFERDSSDNISGAVLQLAGVVSRTTRIEPTKWTADQLAAVEGSYYSQEVDTGYLLQADGDSLSAHHSSHGRIRLGPTNSPALTALCLNSTFNETAPAPPPALSSMQVECRDSFSTGKIDSG